VNAGQWELHDDDHRLGVGARSDDPTDSSVLPAISRHATLTQTSE
jgi:hypothetical protein